MMSDQFAGEQSDILDKIIWPVKTCFKLCGHVNWHNSGNWADKNSYLTIKTQLNQPDVIVWGVFLNEDVVGSIFFNRSVNGEKLGHT